VGDTDTEGKLIGFERVNELLHSPMPAPVVTRAAQRFGQENNISVISVTCTDVLEPALA
jgi:hypothetical protein